MSRLFILMLVLLTITPLLSAEIIIHQQPKETYNLGDIISVPSTIKTSSQVTGFYYMDLICQGREVNFHRTPISLSAGEEKEIDSSLPLSKGFIDELKGNCVIKVSLEEEYVLTNEFKISDTINSDFNLEETNFNPGDSFIIEGSATKENGEAADGFVDILVLSGNNTEFSQLETLTNGFFSAEIVLPEDLRSGPLVLAIEPYEIDSSEQETNKGFFSRSIEINQVPTSLEIILEQKNIEPGTNLRAKTILHDQTGEGIESNSRITIKNSNDKIIDQLDVQTEEFFDFYIESNELASTWKILASSNELEREASFEIVEKELIKIEIINRTLTITNTGNVPYNDTALVKVGNETLNIDVYLDYGESQRYLLSAPDGEYNIEIISRDNNISESVALTGNAISIREASDRIGSLVRYPAIWVFLIIVIGSIGFVISKKGYRKTFIGYISKKRKPKKQDVKVSQKTEKKVSKGSVFSPKNPAEISLSIKGNKQEASIIAIHIKNLNDIISKKSNAKETIQKIIDFAESYKATTYESRNELFFILAPIRTRTFRNEKAALEISLKAADLLKYHNKMFKQKIEFGISLNQGEIVAKDEKTSLKFMSLGTLMVSSKKIAASSKQEILLSEKMNNKLRSQLKTEKHEKGSLSMYSIIEIKNKNTEEHRKFIKNFLEKQDKK